MSPALRARRFVPALLLALSLALGGAAPASAEDWQFGNLKLRWLDGFRYVPQGDVERFLGPQGEGGVVSAAGFGAKTDAERAPLLARHRAFAETELPRLAFVRGGLELPLARAQSLAPRARESLDFDCPKVEYALGLHMPVHELPGPVPRACATVHDAPVVAHPAAELVARGADVDYATGAEIHDTVDARPAVNWQLSLIRELIFKG